MKLTAGQKRYQQAVGGLRFPELTDPNLTLLLQKASTVMCFPPVQAYTTRKGTEVELCTFVVNLLLEKAYERRDIGITYGGVPSPTETSYHLSALKAEKNAAAFSEMLRRMADGAPLELEASCDASAGNSRDGTAGQNDIHGMLITMGKGMVHSQSRKIAVGCESSCSAEMYALAQCALRVIYARNIGRAYGVAGTTEPTTVLTDGESARVVITGEGAAGRSRQDLRRVANVKARTEERVLSPTFCPDAEMPSDFLTKWLPKAKKRASLEYATNAKAWER